MDNDNTVDQIEIVIEDRVEAQILLDVLNAAIDKGNKDKVILDLAYKLDAGICQWINRDLEVI